jgi:5-methylcytosine-specific restriction endonuclease McrA
MIRRKALLDELKRVSEIVGRTPTEEDMLEHGNFAYSTYFRYFESWTRAKSIAGVDDPADVKISDEELLTELRRVEQFVDGSPTRREVDRVAEYPSSTYKHRFGSWNEALEAADLSVNECKTVGGVFPYGPEWETHRQKVLQRDEYRCRICERTATELTDSLHVHHIQPLRTFIEEDGSVDSGRAHDSENLGTLCASWHKTHEGRYCEASASEFVRRVKDSETQ